jgi:hypothetical protein
MSGIILVSFRRAGSHLFKDMVNQNFKIYQRGNNFEDLDSETILKMKQDEIITCHGLLEQEREKIEACVNEGYKIILQTRDMKDVSTSFLFYCDWKTTEDCYRYCLEKQIEFYNSWKDYNFDHILSFEDIINNYNNILNDISSVIKVNLHNPIKDVRMNKSDFIRQDKYKNFRKGIVGDYKNHMPKEFVELYNENRNYSSFVL